MSSVLSGYNIIEVHFYIQTMTLLFGHGWPPMLLNTFELKLNCYNKPVTYRIWPVLMSLQICFCFVFHIVINTQSSRSFKGTQDWEFFWLRFWNLRYFFVSYIKILRFYQKNFLIGPLLGEVRFFRVVLGLRGTKKNFELGPKIFFLLFQFWTLNMTQY